MSVIFVIFIIIINILIILLSSIFIRNYLREKKFKNQKYLSKETIILITGGCLGLGRELIHLLISLYNCKIINLDIRESEFHIMEELYNKNLKNIHCNIAKIKDIIKFLEENDVNINEIDLVINNAAIANNLPLEQLSLNNMISTIEINLLAPMKIIKSFIDYYNKNKNNQKQIHFVTLCSVMSHIISANSSDYITSKWGLFAFMESVGNEYLYNNKYIFTTICPFATNTGMFPNFIFCMDKKWVSKQILQSIVLKEQIKFIPDFINFPIYLYKFLPSCLSNLVQYYIINPFSKNLGRRIENDNLLK